MIVLYECAACGAQQERDDVVASAGPDRVHWFCRDSDACRRRTGR